ncbi:MAG: type I restriction-modification system subunit M N-terminal domain-containing protein [Desulfobacteraceae bacterium]|jgi:type I restriction enzyme M protein
MNENKQQLEQQLWSIANTLQGKMVADDFRDYILGFIFHKYLSEKMHSYADEILKPDGEKYEDIDENTKEGVVGFMARKVTQPHTTFAV